ncbi:MAG: CBS domain-containing protein [Reyranella sp.]|nr:CBS domain-containing protein [Reyranella sp.]
MRAKDIMTESIVCVNVKETVFDAAELLLGAGVSAAPVVNDQGNVLGIVSEADLIHRAEIATTPRKSWLQRLLGGEATAARDFVSTHARKVADVMTREVVTASDDATLVELVELIEKHRVKRIPIVRDNKLVGVVSRANLLGALLSREPEAAVEPTDDNQLRQAVVDAFDKQPWKSRWPVNVVVSDGAVHLWGFVESEDVRKAYRVAAENVPGVKKVRSHLRSIPATVGMGV